MGTIYGYCRISTQKQNLERQVRGILRAFPSAKIYQDTWTGRQSSRPEWEKLQKRLQSGDTVVFESVSRMSRNAGDGFRQYQALYEKGVKLVFLKERYMDTASYEEAMRRIQTQTVNMEDPAVSKLANTILQAIREFMLCKVEQDIFRAFEQSEQEVELLRERTREGILTAQLNGKHVGRPVGANITTRIERSSKEIIRKHSKDFGGTLSDKECIRLAGCSRNSYYKYKRELRSDNQKNEKNS
jgi:DNA invertase Pin-like site-specific DNA recombinase